jgi:hypothetical protein
MLTPNEMAQRRLDLSEEYSRFAGEYAQHIKLQADHFNTNRENYKSDTSTQRAFDATPDGVRMTILKLKLKSIEKSMSALNTALRLAENEAKNLY